MYNSIILQRNPYEVQLFKFAVINRKDICAPLPLLLKGKGGGGGAVPLLPPSSGVPEGINVLHLRLDGPYMYSIIAGVKT